VLEGGRRPSEIWWVKPSRMTPVPDETNYLKGFLYKPANGGKEIKFTPDEVVWFRYPNPLDEFSALSPIAAARLSADVASAGMKSNRDLFRNGLQLAGFVVPDKDKVTFSEPQAKDLEKDLARRWSGADKAHRWAVLRYEARFQQMDVTPKDAEFVNAMNLSARHVWRAFHVPAPLLNDGEFATLANLKVYQTVMWEHGLVPDGDLLTDDIYEQLVARHFKGAVDLVAFDYSDVPALQDAHTATWDREKGQIEAGAITINEWRKANGMPDVAWGDQPWMPVNKAKVNPDGSIEITGTASDASSSGDDVEAIGLMLQKIYLAVGIVITAEEARQLVNRIGAGLPTTLPPELVKAPAPSMNGNGHRVHS
jgi:HK97 family phage portal protein